ncbi:MAG TPA: T9SS type A sorting domain-containing protein [Bacteroidia bacterium]|jgi:hypothetical protein
MKKILQTRRLIAFAFFVLMASATFAQLPNVLIAACPGNAGWNGDVKVKLMSTGQFSNVDIFDISAGNLTMAQLAAYDAVLVYTDMSPMSSTALGDTLAAYIDAGGGVVACVFYTTGIGIGGAFNTPTYQCIIPSTQTQNVQLTLGTIHFPNHPLVQGVTSFNGGTSSYHSTSTTLSPGAYRVADWSDGSFLITAKNNVGPMGVNRVDLDFFPPSDSVRNDFWVDSTAGALIMANALTFVTMPTSGIANHGSDLRLRMYPNPAQNIVHLVSGADAAKFSVSILDISGRVVYSLETSDVMKGQDIPLEISNLGTGVYTVRVNSNTASHVEKLVITK